MGILFMVLLVVLHLVCVGIDIAIFFVLCRLFLIWRGISWLERLNDVGRELVDAFVSNISRLWYRIAQKQLSTKGELLVSLIALSFARLVLCEIVALI